MSLKVCDCAKSAKTGIKWLQTRTAQFYMIFSSIFMGDFLGYHRHGKKLSATGLIVVTAVVLAVGLYKHIKRH
jgi:hypothetical protein